jgi:uncharacterized protein (DUF1778 family)
MAKERERFTFRATKEDIETLKKRAESKGMSLSEYLLFVEDFYYKYQTNTQSFLPESILAINANSHTVDAVVDSLDELAQTQKLFMSMLTRLLMGDEAANSLRRDGETSDPIYKLNK